ncbi:orf98 [Cryptophlebia peltastica nucleopolyhedrovirus]|uniref:Orf98 n=1 Tax=Cryptophlebia peltastica nucleopolyhedrovirus TaxID=2304025 RepID=A0A346RNW7_9ABAC|nr:orf98 [Cryptophlebia peltastica nucleopolyhedrovirus]AXS67764.1 orf98 [Cryptophlebia peltastica nucleopolyhedrovirus]
MFRSILDYALIMKDHVKIVVNNMFQELHVREETIDYRRRNGEYYFYVNNRYDFERYEFEQIDDCVWVNNVLCARPVFVIVKKARQILLRINIIKLL